MKSCLTSTFLFCLLVAILVGMFYIFTQNETIAQQQDEHLREKTQNNLKSKAIRRQVEKMGEDQDGDGLTLAEEQRLGTSDFKVDTDGDQVPDKYDIVPKKRGRKVVKYLNWKYKSNWDLDIGIPIDVISYYEKVKRPVWKGNFSYYTKFIDTKDAGISQLAKELSDIIKREKTRLNWDYYDEVMFIVKMVQSLRYVDDRLTGFDDYTKYPMQTINDGTGDCEDLAILAAALLHRLDYQVKLVHLDKADSKVAHLGIAVWGEEVDEGTYMSHGGKEYYYIEMTGSEWDYGEMPEEWEGDDVDATLISL